MCRRESAATVAIGAAGSGDDGAGKKTQHDALATDAPT
jgi:hypothetical protein